MELQSIKDRIPDYAKDLRLNLDAVLNRSSLTPGQASGAALAAAFAAKSAPLVAALRDAGALEATHAQAALTAAALMGMNNVWYPYVEMAADPELKTVRPELRMNAYATHGGVDKTSFELYALAASIVGKCEFCIQSHYKLLRENGFTTQELRDVGRIAAVVNAVAQVLAAERIESQEPVAA
jgi:alkyl hydroperoxide reductase subunit D